MLTLYEPKYEELWFRRRMLADAETMAYNHAWGGTVDFPEENWRGLRYIPMRRAEAWDGSCCSMGWTNGGEGVAGGSISWSTSTMSRPSAAMRCSVSVWSASAICTIRIFMAMN